MTVSEDLIYVILVHDHEPNELRELQAYRSREDAEKRMKAISDEFERHNHKPPFMTIEPLQLN